MTVPFSIAKHVSLRVSNFNSKTRKVKDLLLVGTGNVGRSAKDSLHSGQEFSGRERLRHVVVCAYLQPQHTVNFVHSGTEHYKRHVTVFTNVFTDVKAINSRQHKVKDHEVRLLRLDGLDSLSPVSGAHDNINSLVEI